MGNGKSILFIAACVIGILLLLIFWRGQTAPQFSGCPTVSASLTAYGVGGTEGEAVAACTTDYLRLVGDMTKACKIFCAQYACNYFASFTSTNTCSQNTNHYAANAWRATSSVDIVCECFRSRGETGSAPPWLAD